MDPVELGAKIALFEENGLRPKTYIIGQVGIPFLASKTVRPDNAFYSLRLTMQHSLSSNTALGYNIGYANEEQKSS